MTLRFVALILSLPSIPCIAQSPWNGTWLVDTDRTHIRPDDLTIQKANDNYTIGEAPGSPGFRCDRKEYPAPGACTSRCDESADAVRTTQQVAGKVLETRSYQVSQDGRSLTVTTTTMRASPPGTVTETYARTGAVSRTIAGTWQGRTTIFAGVVYIMRVHDGYFYFNDTLEGAVSDAKLDGTPARFQDPSPPNSTWSNVEEGPRRIRGTYLMNGKPVVEYMLELSGDGTTLCGWKTGDEAHSMYFHKR